MKASNGLCLGAAAVLGLAAALATYTWRLSRQTRAAQAEASGEAERVEVTIAKQEARLLAARRQVNTLESQIVLASQATAKRAAARQAQPNPRTLADLIAVDPILRDLNLKSFRASLAERFGLTYQRLGLSAQQIARFEDMATAHEDDRETLFAAGNAQGMAAGDASLEGYHQQTVADYYASLAKEISPEWAQAVVQMDQDRNRQGPLGAVVALANSSMMASDVVPLTFEQMDHLTQLAASHSPEYSSGRTVDLETLDWSAVESEARNFLTAPQLQGLEASLQLNQIRDRLRAFYGRTEPPK